MWNNNPLALQAKKNALGNLAGAGSPGLMSPTSLQSSTAAGAAPQANDLTMKPQTGIGGVTFSNPNTFGLPTSGITNMDRSKIDPSYEKRNRFGINKLFTKTPKPPKVKE